MPSDRNKADQKAAEAREAAERRKDAERLQRALENPRGWARRKGPNR